MNGHYGHGYDRDEKGERSHGLEGQGVRLEQEGHLVRECWGNTEKGRVRGCQEPNHTIQKMQKTRSG